MKKGFTLFELVIIMAFVILLTMLSLPKIEDVKNARKANEVQANLITFRVALEEYYQQVGEYPDLEGQENSLMSIVGEDASGKTISFGEVIGLEVLPSTRAGMHLLESNKVYNVTDFNPEKQSGGWLYNYEEQSGELHPNLPQDIYNQEIEWLRQ